MIGQFVPQEPPTGARGFFLLSVMDQSIELALLHHLRTVIRPISLKEWSSLLSYVPNKQRAYA